MKVNHRAPKVMHVTPEFAQRALNQALTKIQKLQAANKVAVDRAIELARKVEVLEKLVASLRDPKPSRAEDPVKVEVGLSSSAGEPQSVALRVNGGTLDESVLIMSAEEAERLAAALVKGAEALRESIANQEGRS